MKLVDILRDTAEEYAARQIAHVRAATPDEEDDLHWRGHILDAEGKPARRVGLVVAVTGQPAEALEIRELDGPAPAGVVAASALDELGGIVSFEKGRSGILWVNAGQPAVLAGNQIANALRHYQLSVQREEDGQSWKESSRRLPWSMFQEVKLFRGRKRKVVMDWLAATVAAQSDAGDQPPPPES